MNTKCFINASIYLHNNITAKSWVLANFSAKNFSNTKTRALIYCRLYGIVAEWIKHIAFNISHLL